MDLRLTLRLYETLWLTQTIFAVNTRNLHSIEGHYGQARKADNLLITQKMDEMSERTNSSNNRLDERGQTCAEAAIRSQRQMIEKHTRGVR